MWQDKVKEVIDILENSNVNEIEVTFWGRKIRVVKNASNLISSASSSNDLMVMRTGSRTMFSISNAGVLQLGEYQGSTPTPVEGGLLYSGSEFFIGL